MEDTTGLFLRHLYLSAAEIDIDDMIGHIRNFYGLLCDVKFDEIQSKQGKIQILITDLRQRHPTALCLVLDYLLANGFRAVFDSISYDMTRCMLSLEERNQSGPQNVVVQTVSIDGNMSPAVESANGGISNDKMVGMDLEHEEARIVRIGGFAIGKMIEIFHPTNSSVSHVAKDLADLIPVQGHQCQLIDKNQVLVIGGDSDANCYEGKRDELYNHTSYVNMKTFAVKPGPSLPTPIAYAAASALNGILYISGGATGPQEDATTACYKLTDTNQKWVAISSLNVARCGHMMSALNGHLYAIGGVPYLKSIERYDPRTDKWIELGSQMNVARMYTASLVHRGKIWVTGGITTEVFDPVTETWSYGPRLIHIRERHSMVQFRSKMYAIGGFQDKTMEVFNDDANEWEMVNHELERDLSDGDCVVIE